MSYKQILHVNSNTPFLPPTVQNALLEYLWSSWLMKKPMNTDFVDTKIKLTLSLHCFYRCPESIDTCRNIVHNLSFLIKVFPGYMHPKIVPLLFMSVLYYVSKYVIHLLSSVTV